MEEKILEIISRSRKALDIHEIETELGFNSVEQLKELIKILNKMEDELKIYRTKKNNYMLFENSNSKVGILSTTVKGTGYVMLDNGEEIKVPEEKLNGSINKDKVVVNITDNHSDPQEGEIIRIIERDVENVVGTVYYDNKVIHVRPDDRKLKIDIVIDKNYYHNLVDGHKVIVKLLSSKKRGEYRGEIIKVLGHVNDPGVDILSIMAKYGIRDEFPEEVMEQVKNIPDKVSEEEIKERCAFSGRDLREEMIFTIDGDDTKDIDDAISIKRLDNGNYQLGVHIADVSYYVTEDSPLDKEAFERGTSGYFADRVTPMLPHELSNGICSLNPNEDRLALSCIMEIDTKGDVVDYEIFESVIRSRIQMTYNKVNQILENNIVPEGYEPYQVSLLMMRDLAAILRKNKERKGYIDFDIDEPKIIVNDKGEAIDVVLRNRGVGEKLIEDFMIAANETVATHFIDSDYDLVFRVHGEPSEEKINNFMHLVSVLGYTLTGKIKKITPKAIQDILYQLKDKKEFYILSSQLLRSMQKAEYSTNNIGHFGLASKRYCHFTSPIRRYPDLSVHRSLRKYFFNRHFDIKDIKHWDGKLPLIADHSSRMERAAVNCEREVDDMKMAEYMEKHIGEQFSGIITSVTNYGFYVQLPNMIEGLVRVEDLKGDYYEFDENSYSLIGNKNKRGYRLGDNVDVVVIGANKELHTIDFALTGIQKKDSIKSFIKK